MGFETNSKTSTASNTNSKQQQSCENEKGERCVTSKRTKRLFIAFAAISIAAVVMVFHGS